MPFSLDLAEQQLELAEYKLRFFEEKFRSLQLSQN
jgi:hypothetical protein